LRRCARMCAAVPVLDIQFPRTVRFPAVLYIDAA
jgi:hypothetical protein